MHIGIGVEAFRRNIEPHVNPFQIFGRPISGFVLAQCAGHGEQQRGLLRLVAFRRPAQDVHAGILIIKIVKQAVG